MTTVHACTGTSLMFLPRARVLVRSFREHHPDGEMWVFLFDDKDRQVDPDAEGFHAIYLEDLGFTPLALDQMVLYHSDEIPAVMKPWLFKHLMSRGATPFLYLDADMQVFGPLDDIAELAARHGIVLTPHVLAPMPRDGKLPDEDVMLAAGQFNAGFFGIGPGGGPLVAFLEERLRRECVADPAHMRLNEQRWLDFVPSCLDAHLLRDPGVNAAYWNLYERPLARAGDSLTAGGAPLRLFHFSGYDFEHPDVVSRHMGDRPRVRFADDPILADLYRTYRRAVAEADDGRFSGRDFWFRVVSAGVPVDPTLRQLYRNDVLRADAAGNPGPPSAYDPAAADAFRAWAVDAYGRAGLPLPPWLAPPPAPRPSAEAAVGPSGAQIEEQLKSLAQATSQALSMLATRIDQLEQRLPHA
jgi:hypothetical protein